LFLLLAAFLIAAAGVVLLAQAAIAARDARVCHRQIHAEQHCGPC
jgi:hypothetical protein